MTDRRVLDPWGHLSRRKGGDHVDGSGGGPHDPGMEARVAKLEAGVEHVQQDVKDLRADFRDLRKAMDRDFRMTWGAMVAGFLGLAGLLAKGFHWIP